MRLIDTDTLELHDFSFSTLPEYAILSHTWGDDEVTFQDMVLPSRYLKSGYNKILGICHLATEGKLRYAWLDNCCIDKSSSAELTESINSMYQWYKNAAVCYVYLQDLPVHVSFEDGFKNCRWLTRGWTLQELLAPKDVEFFDEAWKSRGAKMNYINVVSDCTGIPKEVLQGEADMATYSVARRMSWASKRQTTRIEDQAYSLLGIFDVNMPMIYGEGPKAFRRLQEEIMKRNNDLTILAWDDLRDRKKQALGLLAESPACFALTSEVDPFSDDIASFTVTNKGLAISGIPLRSAVYSDGIDKGNNVELYCVHLGVGGRESADSGGLYLRKIGPGYFYRNGSTPLAGFGRHYIDQVSIFTDITEFCIIIDPPARFTQPASFRFLALHVPQHDLFNLQYQFPDMLWDVTDRAFLKPGPYSFSRYSMVIAMVFSSPTLSGCDNIVVLCEWVDEASRPLCRIFNPENHRRETRFILQARHLETYLHWDELRSQEPEFCELGNELTVVMNDTNYRVSADIEEGIVERISRDRPVFSLKLHVTLLGNAHACHWDLDLNSRV